MAAEAHIVRDLKNKLVDDINKRIVETLDLIGRTNGGVPDPTATAEVIQAVTSTLIGALLGCKLVEGKNNDQVKAELHELINQATTYLPTQLRTQFEGMARIIKRLEAQRGS